MGLVILVFNSLVQLHSGYYNLFICHRLGLSLQRWLRRLPLLPWHRLHSFASTRALFYHIAQFSRILELLRLVRLVLPSLPKLPQIRGRFFPRTKVQLVVARQPSSMCHMKSMFSPLVWPFYQSFKKKLVNSFTLFILLHFLFSNSIFTIFFNYFIQSLNFNLQIDFLFFFFKLNF